MMEDALTPDKLLLAYANGYFPMALNKDDPELYWFSPEERGVLPLETFNIPRGLKRSMKHRDYTITVDTAFEAVIRACGTLTKERHETWINEHIVTLYTELFARGQAHSIEVWESEKLVGGLYGVSLGGAFFGESMFSRAPDASKMALVRLVEILRGAGYTLLDTQYVNEHLKQFGVEAWEKPRYMMKLETALNVSPNPSLHFKESAAR